MFQYFWIQDILILFYPWKLKWNYGYYWLFKLRNWTIACRVCFFDWGRLILVGLLMGKHQLSKTNGLNEEMIKWAKQDSENFINFHFRVNLSLKSERWLLNVHVCIFWQVLHSIIFLNSETLAWKREWVVVIFSSLLLLFIPSLF